MIHAGAVFWHVRRYTSDSIIHPFTVFLSAVILSAFGKAWAPIPVQEKVSMSAKTNKAAVENDQGFDPSHYAYPMAPIQDNGGSPSLKKKKRRGYIRESANAFFIQLDRPVDDELVRYFIRAGEGIHLQC